MEPNSQQINSCKCILHDVCLPVNRYTAYAHCGSRLDNVHRRNTSGLLIVNCVVT